MALFPGSTAAVGDMGQNHERLLESPELRAGTVWAALCQEHCPAPFHLLEQYILAALGALPVPGLADFCPFPQLGEKHSHPRPTHSQLLGDNIPMPTAREEMEPRSAAFWVGAVSTKSQRVRGRRRQPQWPHLLGQEGHLGHILNGQ